MRPPLAPRSPSFHLGAGAAAHRAAAAAAAAAEREAAEEEAAQAAEAEAESTERLARPGEGGLRRATPPEGGVPPSAMSLYGAERVRLVELCRQAARVAFGGVPEAEAAALQRFLLAQLRRFAAVCRGGHEAGAAAVRALLPLESLLSCGADASLPPSVHGPPVCATHAPRTHLPRMHHPYACMCRAPSPGPQPEATLPPHPRRVRGT